MKQLIDRATIQRFHQARLEEYGDEPEALGWKTPEGQQRRFAVLTEIADLTGCSVLDVGCGHGDLRAYLGARFDGVRYAGLDHFAPFLDVAVARYGDWPETTFLLGDFWAAPLPRADYVLASGALGYRSSTPDFVFKMIRRLYAACRRGLGFNLLAAVERPEENILAGYPPEPVVAYCRTLTPHLVLRNDYLDDDYTLFLYREAPAR